MGLAQASPTAVTATTGAFVASAGQMIFVMVRQVDAAAATPSGTGLPAFNAISLTSGNATDSGVSGIWYRTLCGISFNASLSFADVAYGYEIYTESGLDTGGTNGSNSVLQACGLTSSDSAATDVNYGSAVTSGNRLIAGFIGGVGTDIGTIGARSGWNLDYGLRDASTIFVIGVSRATTDTAAGCTATAGSGNIYHSVALELVVAGGAAATIQRRSLRGTRAGSRQSL